MTDVHVNSYEIYAQLYSLIAQLSDIPYEYYPHEVVSNLEALLEIFAPIRPSVYTEAFHMGLLRWQSKDAEQEIAKLIENYPEQVKQYKEGNTKVLGFLMGILVKEGCDPIEARDLLIKELAE